MWWTDRQTALDKLMQQTFKFLQLRILNGRPLRIERAMHSTWLVFTDGACEPEQRKGSIGGVLYDPSGACLKFFGEETPSAIMDDFLSASKNPIHELELLPVLVASLVWGEMFAGAQVVFYIDNESARMAYIRGSGETLRGAGIIQTFVERESSLQHRVWFGRVPSFSNPADAPSRMDCGALLKGGSIRTSICWETVRYHLGL